MGRRKAKNHELKEERQSTSSMEKRQSTQEIDSVDKVFSIPLLLDEIVKYSLFKVDGTDPDNKNLVSVRLVNKSWLQSTSRVLKQIQSPVININIGYKNEEANRKKYKKNERILDLFQKVFSKNVRSSDSILPIYVSVSRLYFIEENNEQLCRILEHCGDIICYFNVNFPVNGDLMTIKCKNLKFPILKRIMFFIHNGSEAPRGPTSNTSALECNGNGLQLLKQILQSCNNLKELCLISDENGVTNLETLNLPNSLNYLTLSGIRTGNDVTLPMPHKLSKLEILNLQIGKFFDVNSVNTFLERFRHQLKTLDLENTPQKNNQRNISINFPLMEKLTSFGLAGHGWDLNPKQRYTWPKLVPNLDSLDFQDTSQSLFLNWVEGLRFENVKQSCISFNANNYSTKTISPNVQSIRALISSFPNIQKLRLGVQSNETSGVTYLFQNFTHLKELWLTFLNEKSNQLTGCKLVSLFLGISLERATAIISNRESDVNIRIDNPRSIMNMKELCSFTLSSPNPDSLVRRKDPWGLEIITKYGLHKMPNLRKIDVYDRLNG